ncbi:MAG: RNA polymerase-associated protein RapA [Gammaproteobacteria bacterium]|nr:RNA polymerase-associated protein RapA [Gammaproteobacteria bacterium]
MSFTVGQRWVSQAENDLGLGTVIQVDNRFVQVLFPAADETRNYAIDQAPLMRVEFSPGETLKSLEDFEFVVEHIEQMSGTLVYQGCRVDNGEQVSVKEIMLDHHISLSTPENRLFTGNFDRTNWFSLRLEAHQHKAEQDKSHLQGLQGARVSLIPHQLYIADTVGKRFAPRVLLADEVGLGKTIEAGLIIHQQLTSGRSQRVLIVLPESLQHQWLVEMLRRFNLRFSLFDDERCEAEAETAGDDASSPSYSPFDSEQQVIISQEWLSEDGKWQQSLLNSEWDLVVIDEAHHITPEHHSEENPKTQQLFEHVQQIGQKTKGLILLTATPDQLGHYGHFCRLQLLDPARFHNYEQFKQEEADYQKVADIANQLLEQTTLTGEQANVLQELLPDETSLIAEYQTEQNTEKNSELLLTNLLDRHGTGRIMFRNSRHGIKGFPERKVTGYPLNVTDDNYPNQTTQTGIQPETQHNGVTDKDAWWNLDPRVDWLCQFLLTAKSNNKADKILIICAQADTAIKLDEVLFEREGLRTTVFHEGMSIVERDKAAAYFADEENSAQALICSEIGSEGRNFQFAHHLVLFDLPANPDLLEQRIGRLDRIGQTETVKIHVPYLTNSAQENLFNWYHQAFNAFEQTSTTARLVAKEFQQEISAVVLTEDTEHQSDPTFTLSQLIDACKSRNSELKQEVEQGRDRLLEINSSGGNKAQQIAEQVAELDDSNELMNYMERIWDQFGVQHEEKTTFSKILHPGEHMLHDHFPQLMEDGMTVCFEREQALSQEDQHFLTWEHPMVTGALDMLTTGELGNSAVCLLPHKQLPAGTMLLETNYVLSTSAPKSLQLQRYLPTTGIRLMLDKNGNNLADKVKQGSLDKALKNAKKQMALQLIKALKDEIATLLEKGETIANAQAAQVKQHAKTQLVQQQTEELNRMLALKKLNPAIRNEEIEHLKHLLERSEQEIENAKVNLDAVRLIVVTQG